MCVCVCVLDDCRSKCKQKGNKSNLPAKNSSICWMHAFKKRWKKATISPNTAIFPVFLAGSFNTCLNSSKGKQTPSCVFLLYFYGLFDFCATKCLTTCAYFVQIINFDFENDRKKAKSTNHLKRRWMIVERHINLLTDQFNSVAFELCKKSFVIGANCNFALIVWVYVKKKVWREKSHLNTKRWRVHKPILPSDIVFLPGLSQIKEWISVECVELAYTEKIPSENSWKHNENHKRKKYSQMCDSNEIRAARFIWFGNRLEDFTVLRRSFYCA